VSGLPRPKALLLDFGGVIVETRRRGQWVTELAKEVCDLLARSGFTGLGPDDVETDIRAGAAADKCWKDAMSRPFAPREMTHREFWGDYVAADWPEPARAVVIAEATPLCHRMGVLRSDRAVRAGMPDLLAAAWARDVRPAIVSNALCGAVHRDFLAAAGGLDRRFALQVYSDEAGVRKPNPEMIWIACPARGADPADVGYCGHHHDRDVVCGARAGVGATVLMVSRSTAKTPYTVRQRPDATVDDPHGLLTLLEAT
jgi:FMN phosphatase YigB (HAD superfamily)